MSKTSLGIDAGAAITLEPEILAGKLLFLVRHLSEQDSSYRPRHDELQVEAWRFLIGYEAAAHLRQEYLKAFSEAWSWLEVQGLLVPDRDIPHATGSVETGRRQLSRRAVQFADEVNVRHYAAARRLPRDSLHPMIAQTAWAAFIRGEYDVAVFQAMKAVEMAVRSAGKYSPSDTGMRLMRKAFDPKSGRLSDMDAEEGERDARSALFAGAIGAYKNPHSHRKVPLDDPAEATEIVLLANQLLRIVDSCPKRT